MTRHQVDLGIELPGDLRLSTPPQIAGNCALNCERCLESLSQISGTLPGVLALLPLTREQRIEISYKRGVSSVAKAPSIRVRLTLPDRK